MQTDEVLESLLWGMGARGTGGCERHKGWGAGSCERL